MERNPVTGVRLSSVVPATTTGDNKPHKFTAIDLAVKLHYVRSVYFFKSSPSIRNLTVDDFKEPMFQLLRMAQPSISGRIRRSEPNDDDSGGRPYIRCNDSGVRVVEASVEDFTVNEWLTFDDRSIDHEYLVYDHVLGPDLRFSPPVVLQITRFKCGGRSLGLNWAHVLGDSYSASVFMNMLGLTMAGGELPKSIKQEKTECESLVSEKLFSIKKIEPVGDHWVPTNKCKMGRYTFCISSEQIKHLMTTHSTHGQKLSDVEILYATIWKLFIDIRKRSPNLKVITICGGRRSDSSSNSGMEIKTIANEDFSDGNNDIARLATLIVENKVSENGSIQEMIEKDGGVSDFILYGANLTFVNLDEPDIYGFELKGEKPEFVNYTMHGIGDEGVIMVFPGPDSNGKIAKVVSMVIPEEQLLKVKDELTILLGNMI